MASKKINNFRTRKKVSPKQHAPLLQEKDNEELLQLRDRNFTIAGIAILFLFGIFYSIRYYGFHIMPSPDFPSFLQIGKELWHFKIPTSFFRGPTYGFLVYPLTRIVGGQHPELSAAWLFNAILQPFNLVLLFLIGKKIVGKSALWIVLIAMLNPWLLEVFTKPIAEICMLFFIFITFFFMFRRSRWCYLFASMAAMLRYECAALILAAFVLDMIYLDTKKERIRALCYSVIAGIPLVLWMIGMKINNTDSGSINYGQFMDISKLFEGARLKRELNLLWTTTFGTFFRPGTDSGEKTAQILDNISKVLVCLSFLFGVTWGLIKKNWNILALLIFFIPYMLIHIPYQYSDARFYVPVFWILLLICWYGIQSLWQIINSNNRVPRYIILPTQLIISGIFIIWFVSLARDLPKLSTISPKSVVVPYVAIAVSILAAAASVYIYKRKHLWRNVAILAFVCMTIASNQFTLAGVVRDGTQDGEFKQLLEWYEGNAKPGEKLVTTLAQLLGILRPAYKDYFIAPGELIADSPEGFVERCYEEDITYVTWDSRKGFQTNDAFYKLAGLDNIAFLQNQQNIGQYEYITTIVHPTQRWRYINIFKLRPKQAIQTR